MSNRQYFASKSLLEKVFLSRNYQLYLHATIATILFILFRIGIVSQDLLVTFLAAWLLLYLLSSMIEGKLRFDALSLAIEDLRSNSSSVVKLSSMSEAYSYLTFTLQSATVFKNTLLGDLPPRMKVQRLKYIEVIIERLKDPSFEMYEIFSDTQQNAHEAERKSKEALNNYFFSVLQHPPLPWLPFCIVRHQKGTEILLGWYGETLKAHQKDVYMILKDQRIVELYEDYFNKTFEFGRADFKPGRPGRFS